MIKMPSIITEAGDLRIHNKAGCNLPLNFVDVNGVPRDVSAATIRFEVEGGFSKVLENGDTSDVKVLKIAPDELVAHLNKVADFIVLEPDADLPELWSGKLIVVGWA